MSTDNKTATQPNKMSIETIVLTKKEFDSLPEYSCSIPTGTTIGKKWKRNIYAFDRAAHDPRTGNKVEEWYLHEYIEHPNPNKVGISTKLIIAILKPKPNT